MRQTAIAQYLEAMYLSSAPNFLKTWVLLMTQTTNTSRNSQKQKTFEDWMKLDHVLIHLDSRLPEVELPEHLKNNTSVVLKLSYLFQGTTEHDAAAITAYLKFHGSYHRCVIPWTVVWGMTNSNNESTVWPEDLPMELWDSFAAQISGELAKNVLLSKGEHGKATGVTSPISLSPQPASRLATSEPNSPKAEEVESSIQEEKLEKDKRPEKKVGHLKRVK